MKIEKCPECGQTLIEEYYEPEDEGYSSGSKNAREYEGSMSTYIAPITSKRRVYKCPNCGYLSIDC